MPLATLLSPVQTAEESYSRPIVTVSNVIATTQTNRLDGKMESVSHATKKNVGYTAEGNNNVAKVE